MENVSSIIFFRKGEVLKDLVARAMRANSQTVAKSLTTISNREGIPAAIGASLGGLLTWMGQLPEDKFNAVKIGDDTLTAAHLMVIELRALAWLVEQDLNGKLEQPAEGASYIDYNLQAPAGFVCDEKAPKDRWISMWMGYGGWADATWKDNDWYGRDGLPLKAHNTYFVPAFWQELPK